MIRLEGVKKYFGTKPILEDVTFHLPENERLALVGANGAGKTTLLDILTGTQDIDGGKLLKPARLRLGYLPQEPNPRPEATVLQEAVEGGEGYLQALARRHRQALEAMTADYNDQTYKRFEDVDLEYKREGGYALEADARSVLSGLGFSESMMNASPTDLSGGWRMRLELAKIFVNRPNFLILDEPTNHLDLPSLVWVERWLQNYQGTLVFVSHDRGLLDKLPTMTLHLQGGRLTGYKGNFSQFLEQRELRMSQDAATAENLKRQREHLQSFVDRFGAKATKAAQAQSRLKMIARIRELEDAVVTESDAEEVALRIPMGQQSGREVLKVKNMDIGYEKTLASNVNMLIERGQKIAVIGANGIGKSTFLKTLVGHVPTRGGASEFGINVKWSWFAQDQLDTLNAKKSIWDNVFEGEGQMTQKEVRSMLGCLLFHGDDVYKSVQVLSGGEKARVGLARMLAQKSNFLIMDEPTNHLDLSSVEILTAALQEYEGTMLFVSHDRTFINALCTHVFVMLPDGRSSLFVGQLDDYQRLAKKSGFPNVLELEPSRPQEKEAKNKDVAAANKQVSERDRSQDKKREVTKLTKELQNLETQIAEYQKKIADLDRKLESSDGAGFSELSVLGGERQEAEERLLEMEERWLVLSGEIESRT
jgi:ATP-binding cassette, subfamily F, member 3